MQQIQVSDNRELLYEASSMRKIVADVKLFAPTDLPVLITGSNGTGKENIARLVHSNSKRNSEPFIAINCAAISPGLIESELFGHEKGSFTGASAKRIGAFEQAKNGTIFLDEIGEMPDEMQAKLLRVLEDGEFSRVGGNETVTARPRIISATNRDIEQAVKDGKLREDLYYRLRGTQIELPDLKDRTTDIPMLARHYASKVAVQYDLPPIDFSEDALVALKDYAWPGNVRELKNRITEASIRASQDGGVITADMLHLTPQSNIAKSLGQDGTPVKDSFGYKVSMHREERGWTQKQLAQRINLKSGSKYDDNDVMRWEANFELPNSEALAALSYLLIINNPNVAQGDKAHMLHDFMDRAQKSDYVQGVGEALQEQDNFGKMMRTLREGLI